MVSKNKNLSIVDELEIIANWTLLSNGFFHSHRHQEAEKVFKSTCSSVLPSRASVEQAKRTQATTFGHHHIGNVQR
jgi:hypothetical protein